MVPVLPDMPIRALLFDFGGTLDADGVPWKDRFRALFARRGANLPAEAFDRAFYDSDDPLTDRADPHATYAGTVRELSGSLARRLGRPDLAAAVAEEFLAGSRERIAQNLEVLRRLGRRYALGIVSNFYGNLDATLAETGLDAVVRVAADSARVGATKPDAAIFRWALERLEVEPADAVMVGDSVPRDVEGARRLGMPYRLLLRADRAAPPPGVDPACVIRSLGELEGGLP